MTTVVRYKKYATLKLFNIKYSTTKKFLKKCEI